MGGYSCESPRRQHAKSRAWICGTSPNGIFSLSTHCGTSSLPLLIGHNHGSTATILGQTCRRRPASPQCSGCNCTPIDQGDCQPIGNYRPEFFHQVERERRPPWAQYVQKADLRIKAYSLNRRHTLPTGNATKRTKPRLLYRGGRFGAPVRAQNGRSALLHVTKNTSRCAPPLPRLHAPDWSYQARAAAVR